jgi:hypothetical protein
MTHEKRSYSAQAAALNQKEKMAREEKTFEDLIKEAPRGGTVSLVGALAQSSEAGKFVLNLQDGRTMTLETASVKGHTVLGTLVGQTIVRIDVDAATIPASAPGASTVADIYTPPGVDHTLAWLDHGPKPFWQDAPPPYQLPSCAGDLPEARARHRGLKGHRRWGMPLRGRRRRAVRGLSARRADEL